ncbi:helix-turn-helix domain-containing protein [Streptomyces sp. NPDC004237]|uniref:TrmB family transcriptional regulator n=1 Tax=Streptomyces sp. NPDC004237 TaxID=3154455 RepID=UPI0033BAFE1A
MVGNGAGIAQQLTELGFSQYEARAYIGLLGQDPLTGYALANLTGIPQPKVYETLRRLAEKRAVVQIGSDPARFVAVPTEHLLSQLDADFRRRLAEAKAGFAELGRGSGDEELRVLRSPRGWAAIIRHAGALLDGAERHVYLSAHADQLGELGPPIRRADERGVRLDVLCFGSVDLELTNGRLLRHASTDGMVYRRHQARHVACVADGRDTLWALAADGTQWDAVVAADPLLAAVVKGYVRHDLYLQEIFADFPDQLEEAYGPGLAKLVTPYAEPTGGPRAKAGPRRKRSA